MERICKNCIHWIPNGGVLGYGYCSAKKWVYRKPTQTCDTKYSTDKFQAKEQLNTNDNERLQD